LTTAEASREFHVIRAIASGGFGSVYLVKVVHADGFSRLVAMKLLHPKWSENEEISSRMRDEARLLGWLRHRNIVDVMDLTRVDGRVAVLMEYLEAVDCKAVINHCLDSGQLLPVRVVLDICSAVASALDAAYSRPPYAGEKPLRVIHRDIKPSNVMIDESGLIKVLDFGVARAEFDTREARTQEMAFGSLEYMPPERLFFEPDSHLSDVYSLGTMFYELLALEKLGKARLRPIEQERFIEERWGFLAGNYPMPSEEVAWGLRELVFDMLSFEEEDRPTAADCVTRMRTLARQIQGEPSAMEWAEDHVAPLVAAFQARPQEPDPLQDKVLLEDSRGIPRADGDNTDPQGLATAQAAGPSTFQFTEPDRVDQTGAENQRWQAIKAATLAEITEGGAQPRAAHPEVTPVQPRPGERSSRRAQEWEDDDDVGGGGLLIGALLLGGILLAIGVVAVVVVAVVMAVSSASMRDESPPVEPAEVGPPPAEEVADEAPAAQPDEPFTRFESAADATKKITVRCTAGAADGVFHADVIGSSPGHCTVTVVDTSRRRYIAVVDKAQPGTYVCFAGGEKECTRQR